MLLRRQGVRAIQALLSSSTPHRRRTTKVRGARQYLFVNRARAIELGHKVAFHVDASRIARLPLTADYFPGLADRMVRVIGHDPDFVVKVEQRLRELIAAGFRITKVDAVQDRESRPR
jgi:hypothetical protein